MAATYAAPFLQFGSGIVIRKEDAAKYKKWQDLDKDGLKVAVALGSTGDTFASKKFANANVVRLRTEPELLMSLVTKKVNAWHSTYGAFQKILPKNPNLMIMPATTLAIVPTGFVVRQGDWTLGPVARFLHRGHPANRRVDPGPRQARSRRALHVRQHLATNPQRSQRKSVIRRAVSKATKAGSRARLFFGRYPLCGPNRFSYPHPTPPTAADY